MKGRLLPDPLVVTRSRIENSSLALRTHPCPRLWLRDVVILSRHLAYHQYLAIFLIVILVLVGLIPSLKFFDPLHRRVLRIDHFGCEGTNLVTVKSTAHQLVESWFVAETPARAMDRNETATTLDVVL